MNSPQEIKQILYNKCLEFIENRHESILHTILEIQEALTSETKSSAGDKHETGRAMLQIEREKSGNQLAEIQKLKAVLSKIDITQSRKVVAFGSVVFTSQANYFIAISAGKFLVNNETFYAISPSTPIGQLLLSKAAGDEVLFRNESFKIKALL